MGHEWDEKHPLILNAERLVFMYQRLTQAEKIELEAWERDNLKTEGPAQTTDWPGWEAVFKRLSH